MTVEPGGGVWSVSRWETSDHSVEQRQKAGTRGVSMDVRALRVSTQTGMAWEGFGLSGAFDSDGVPAQLSGEYWKGAGGEPHPVVLRRSVERMKTLESVAGWDDLLETIIRGLRGE